MNVNSTHKQPWHSATSAIMIDPHLQCKDSYKCFVHSFYDIAMKKHKQVTCIAWFYITVYHKHCMHNPHTHTSKDLQGEIHWLKWIEYNPFTHTSKNLQCEILKLKCFMA